MRPWSAIGRTRSALLASCAARMGVARVDTSASRLPSAARTRGDGRSGSAGTLRAAAGPRSRPGCDASAFVAASRRTVGLTTDCPSDAVCDARSTPSVDELARTPTPSDASILVATGFGASECGATGALRPTRGRIAGVGMACCAGASARSAVAVGRGDVVAPPAPWIAMPGSGDEADAPGASAGGIGLVVRDASPVAGCGTPDAVDVPTGAGEPLPSGDAGASGPGGDGCRTGVAWATGTGAAAGWGAEAEAEAETTAGAEAGVGAGAGAGAGRGGSSESGSTYPSSSAARRIPRWTLGTSCSGVPLEPIVPTAAPSLTASPFATSIVPRWTSVTA
jgi:hypothetical protein